MRYEPPRPKNREPWSRLRVAITSGLLVLAAVLAIVLSAPAWHSQDFTFPFYGDTATLVLGGVGFAIVLPIFLFVLAVLLVLPVMWVAQFTPWRHPGDDLLKWGGARLARAIPVLVAACLVAAICFGGMRNLAAPQVSELTLAHIAAAHVTTSPLLLNVGPYRLGGADTRLSGTHLVVDGRLLSIGGFPPVELLAAPVADEPVSDVIERDANLLVISGRALLQYGPDGTATSLARLPLEHMQLGTIAEPGGASTRILVFGNDASHGHVFELTSEAAYSKLASTDVPVSGAAGCGEDVAIALADQVLMIAPGRRPRILFRRPEGSGPITSVRARLLEGAAPACLWLIATADQVYMHQDGLNVLIATGIGGLITDTSQAGVPQTDASLGFVLLDRRRNTIVNVQLDRGR